jgi:hypothetical protein
MTYKGDPRWLTARYPGKCGGKDCQQPINPGDQVFYYPQGKIVLAKPCGHADTAAADFNSAKFDEEGF